MKYISIGPACTTKYQIDEHKGKSETLFFDWLMTSMDSVIKIIDCKDINSILYADNIIRDPINPYHHNNSRIRINSLDCVSIHDLGTEYTQDDVTEFIEKYKRRFYRILEIIQSNEKVYFIRLGKMHENDIDRFNRAVLEINPNCNFTTVSIDNNISNDVAILKRNHYLSLTYNATIPSTADWTGTYLNWEKIFLDIDQNT